MWETLSAIAAIATTLIIGATAIAAVHQIRQLRLSTQLEGLLALHEEFHSEKIVAAREFVAKELPAKLRDKAYRDEIALGTATISNHREFVLADYWEKIGLLVREGVLDADLYLAIGAYRCIEAWEQLRPVIELQRVKEPLQWEPFDHMARLSREYLEKKKPTGSA
jgi:hypothetical protein